MNGQVNLRILLGCLCIPLTGHAQSKPDSLDRAIRSEMAHQQIPGLSFAVVQHGRIVRLGAYGYGNLEWKTPVTRATRFEIASMSKMFTGTATRLLVDEGRLDLEAPLTQFFAGLPDSWRDMKVRHLVTMSAGIPEDWGGELIPYNADVTTPYSDSSMLRAHAGLPLTSAVGAEFHYSSPSYHLLGLIASKVSGQPLSQFMQQAIFGPAGMTRTSFVDNEAIIPDRADGYRRENGIVRRGWFLGQYLHARADVGILSTAEDQVRWIIALRQGRIVKDPAVLWTFPPSDSGRFLDYAYGWFNGTLLGHHMISHGGRFRTGFRSTINVFPDDDVAVVILTNGDWSNVDHLALIIGRHYLADLPDPESPPADADPQTTAATIAALRSVASGRIDSSAMLPDALAPLSLGEASEFLKAVESFTFAGRGRVLRPLQMHGHQLRDFTSIRLTMGPDFKIVTIYRDTAARIAFVEPTQ